MQARRSLLYGAQVAVSVSSLSCSWDGGLMSVQFYLMLIVMSACSSCLCEREGADGAAQRTTPFSSEQSLCSSSLPSALQVVGS